jgi:gluconokinase
VIIVVMGVSGTGKTTLGRALAAELGWIFLEGDDFHPAANIEKMRNYQPLSDTDRQPWLLALNTRLLECERDKVNAVLACSALKSDHRTRLLKGIEAFRIVFLHGARELIHERMEARSGHFMPAALLDSQVAALEAPRDAVCVDIELSTSEQVAIAMQGIFTAGMTP